MILSMALFANWLICLFFEFKRRLSFIDLSNDLLEIFIQHILYFVNPHLGILVAELISFLNSVLRKDKILGLHCSLSQVSLEFFCRASRAEAPPLEPSSHAWFVEAMSTANVEVNAFSHAYLAHISVNAIAWNLSWFLWLCRLFPLFFPNKSFCYLGITIHCNDTVFHFEDWLTNSGGDDWKICLIF